MKIKWIASQPAMPESILSMYRELRNLGTFMANLNLVNAKTGFDVTQHAFFVFFHRIGLERRSGDTIIADGWFFGAIALDRLKMGENNTYTLRQLLEDATSWVCLKRWEANQDLPIVTYDRKTNRCITSTIPASPLTSVLEPSVADMLAFRIFRDDFYTSEEARDATNQLLSKFTHLK